MEFDEGQEEGREDEGPLFAWLPPEDRLWRHPSEMHDAPTVPNPTVGSGRKPGTATLNRGTARAWTLALAAGLAGALFASGFFMATGITDRRTTVLEPVVTPGTALALSSATQTTVGNWPSIADALAASVVAVRVSNEGSLQVGSGVLYAVAHNESFILTAQDLVGNGGSVVVAFTNGDSQPARVVGADPMTGIAVLATSGTHRSFPTFGSVSNVEVAEQVLAVGTRLASPSAVVSGAVSGLDQTVSTGSGDSDTIVGMLALSNLTVPATGNGGALVDPAGAVVGIVTDLTSTDPSAQDVAYAVPIDVAEHVATQLLAGDHPTHPWMGVDDATDLTTGAARPLGVTGGAQVGVIDPGSPAARLGLRPNDVITAFGGHPVTSSGALMTLLSELQPGDHTTVTFFRQDRKSTVDMTIGEQPPGA